MKRLNVAAMALAGAITVTACTDPSGPVPSPDETPSLARQPQQPAVINVVLDRPPTPEILSDLERYGSLGGRLDAINAVFVKAPLSRLDAIRSRPYVQAAGPNQRRTIGPFDPVEAQEFADGLSTWNLDAVNVTDLGFDNRQVPQDGDGVYVGVLDTGLGPAWERYFPNERIAEEYATAFAGSPEFGNGEVVQVPNKWQEASNWHGTHVTSTIIGYDLGGVPINGVAPGATVIPVKVLYDGGFGWSSMIAAGIIYVADLKAGPLAGHPVVINMSLGGPVLDPVEKAAIDYAVGNGVIVVAAAGNTGTRGMAFPAAYAPVISVAAAGWTGEWLPGGDGNAGNWWVQDDVADPTDAADFYITGFSSRKIEDQDLDVAAPGSWVVGPFQLNSSIHTSYFFLGGTSMASPHVAGIVALMAEKNPSLEASEAEAILEQTAADLPAGCRLVVPAPGLPPTEICWEEDATGAGIADAREALNNVS